jgi:hypothetical protein
VLPVGVHIGSAHISVSRTRLVQPPSLSPLRRHTKHPDNFTEGYLGGKEKMISENVFHLRSAAVILGRNCKRSSLQDSNNQKVTLNSYDSSSIVSSRSWW